LASADSFEAVATEWYESKLQEKSDSYRDRTSRLLKKDLHPSLGARPICQITSAELLMVLCKVEARGAVDMAHRAKQTAGHVSAMPYPPAGLSAIPATICTAHSKPKPKSATLQSPTRYRWASYY